MIALLAGMNGLAAGQVTIDITGSPKLPVPNMLANPGFEKGNSMPENWKVVPSTTYYINSSDESQWYQFKRIQSGGLNESYVRLDVSKSSTLDGLGISQAVKVEPGALYRMGAWVRIRGGKPWIHVRHSDNNYFNSNMVDCQSSSWGCNPIVTSGFLPLEWTQSAVPNKWLWLGCEVAAQPEDDVMYLMLTSARDRASVDFDSAFFGLARTKLSLNVAGSELKNVIVKDDIGKVCWNSGQLQPGTSSLSEVIPDLSTSLRYQVIVTAVDGKETIKWYPEVQ